MILCCGEALIDMIPSLTETGREGFVPHSGGAVFNTAIAMGRLGQQTGLLTGMSNDMFGQQLRASLKASQVDSSLIVSANRPTTLAFVQLTNGHATYSFFDENSAGRMLTINDIQPLPSHVTSLFFGGISLACEPCGDAYSALLMREAPTRTVMLDPNIRPSFVNDIKRYRARLDQVITRTDIVKVSDEDLNWIIPEPLSLREKVEAILDKGPSIVILTRGGEGVTGFLHTGEEVRAPAVPVPIVDTVGAGDTFNAGVLVKLSELGALQKNSISDLSLETLRLALTHGTKVSAVTVSRAGANPPWATELWPNEHPEPNSHNVMPTT